MNKRLFFAFLSVAMVLLCFAGCKTNKANVEDSTASSVTADASVADSEAASENAEAESESKVSSQDNNSPDASESNSKFSAEDNDLEIMTLPDAELTEGIESENDAQPTETSANETEAVIEFNDDEPIELPFVPAE